MQELRDWATWYWGVVDGDIIIDPDTPLEYPLSFKTGRRFDPFFFTAEEFRFLYQDYLTIGYDIYDLIEDDPGVFDAFKHHTMTGRLLLPLNDPQTPLFPSHNECWEWLWDGGCWDCATQRAAERDESASLLQPATKELDRNPCGKNIGPDDNNNGIPDEYEKYKKVFDLIWKPLMNEFDQFNNCRKKDDSWWQYPAPFWWQEPGFDCDDHAEVYGRYIAAKLAELGYVTDWQFVFVFYGYEGHAVLMLEVDGWIYIIDPRSRLVDGPVQNAAHFRECIIEVMKRTYFNDTRPDTWWIDYMTYVVHGKKRWWNDAPSTYDDPALLYDRLNCMGIPPEEMPYCLPEDYPDQP